MPITLSNPTYTTVHNSKSYLVGDVGHIYELSATINTEVGFTSTTNITATISAPNEITINGGVNWLEYGILVGHSIDVDATGSVINTTVTVTEINGNVLKHDGDLTANLGQIYPSFDNGQLVVVNNTVTDVQQLDVFFNLIENESETGAQSFIDGEVNNIRFTGVDAMVNTDVINGVFVGNKSGGALIDATLTKDDTNEYTLYIKFANWVDYTDLDPNEVPEQYVAEKSIKPYIELRGKVDASNPNSNIISIYSNNLGNVGYLAENYNQGVNAFTPISVTYTTNDGQELDEINHTAPTNVEIVVGREGVVNINSNKYVVKIQHLPTDESYKNNAESYLANTFQSILERDTTYTKTAYGKGGAELVISDENTTTGSTTIDGNTYQLLTITFKLTPNTAFTDYFEALNEADRVYRIMTTVQSSALVDDVTVQNHLGQYTQAPVLAGVADEVTDVQFYNHYQNGDEAQGIEYSQLTEDDTLVTATLLMNKADNYDSINVKIRVLDSNNDAFDLFSRVVPMNNYPLNADNVRLVNLVENLDYLLPSTDRNTFELVIGTINSTTYEINLKHTFLNSWRYWLAQANALPEFLDPSLPNNGLNNEWVRYIQGGGTLQYRIEIVKDGVTFYYNQNFDILDYDTSAEVTSTITFEDTAGNPLPSVVDSEDVIVVADHVGTSAWDTLDTWGWIAYRPKESEKRKLISSAWTDNGLNLPLRPISGETKAQLTFPTATTARLKALVKGSEVDENYTFISRINSPVNLPQLDYFILDIRTFNTGTSGFNQFTLPLRSGYTYDFQVEWGDGSVETYAGVAGVDISTDITHTYDKVDAKLANGIFRIKIGVTNNTGFPTIYFNNGGDKEKLIRTVDFNDVGWAILENSFYGCSNNVIEATATADFNSVVNADFAWYGNNLTSFPALDLPNATTLNNTWRDNSLTSFPLIDLGSALSIAAAWDNNQLTSFPAIDLSSVTNANTAWRNNNLTDFPAIDMPLCTLVFDAWNGNDLDNFPAINLSSATNLTNAWRNNGVISTFNCRNFYAMTNGTSCFESTTLATSDWSDILVTQRANNANTGVSFHGGNSTYNVAGGVARGELVSIQSWTITDGGAA